MKVAPPGWCRLNLEITARNVAEVAESFGVFGVAEALGELRYHKNTLEAPPGQPDREPGAQPAGRSQVPGFSAPGKVA